MNQEVHTRESSGPLENAPTQSVWTKRIDQRKIQTVRWYFVGDLVDACDAIAFYDFHSVPMSRQSVIERANVVGVNVTENELAKWALLVLGCNHGATVDDFPCSVHFRTTGACEKVDVG